MIKYAYSSKGFSASPCLSKFGNLCNVKFRHISPVLLNSVFNLVWVPFIVRPTIEASLIFEQHQLCH